MKSPMFAISKYILGGHSAPTHDVAGFFRGLTYSLLIKKWRVVVIPCIRCSGVCGYLIGTWTTGQCDSSPFSFSNRFGRKSKNVQVPMCKNLNCKSCGACSPAQAAPPSLSPQVYDLLHAFFTSPVEVLCLRRDLRRWAMANVTTWQDNFGSSLPEQIQNYEVLDELLHEISMALIQHTENTTQA